MQRRNQAVEALANATDLITRGDAGSACEIAGALDFDDAGDERAERREHAADDDDSDDDREDHDCRRESSDERAC